MPKPRGVRVPYFTSIKRRLQLVKNRVKSSKVELSRPGEIVKKLLSVSQLLFWLMGCVMLGVVAFWLKHSPELTVLLTWPGAPRASLHCLYALIATSGLMLAVGFVGFYVAHSDNPYLIWTLLACALALFTALLTVGSVAIHRRGELAKDMIEDSYEYVAKLGGPVATSRLNTLHRLLCYRQAEKEIVAKKDEKRDEYDKKVDEAEKECMKIIKGKAKEMIRALFAANVRVVAWWSLLVALVMLLQIVLSILLLHCLGNAPAGLPTLTDNPEMMLQK